MLSESVCRTYQELLKEELIEATGCTEPIALSLAGATVRKVLGAIPEKISVFCSGNIIKNVKSVTVPNSGGLRGIECAVLLGIIGGNADDALQVLSGITEVHRNLLTEELKRRNVKVFLAENVPNLYIRIEAAVGTESCEVELSESHTNISRIVKNGEELLSNCSNSGNSTLGPDKSLLNIKDILEYAETADISQFREPIKRQIRDNTAIAEEGLRGEYGACVGKTLLEQGKDVYTRAKAMAAAGSDARMNGCPKAVVINSGSGNQGMTVSLPVIEFAKELGADEDRMIRALVISNLISMHQKKYIGALSAYCGATSAAAAAACAIAWLKGGDEQVIGDTLSTTIATIGGMVCDGAKSSCAGKIASALDCSLRSMDMAFLGRKYLPGEGLVKENTEATVQAVGRMAGEGMRSTDVKILNIMLED